MISTPQTQFVDLEFTKTYNDRRRVYTNLIKLTQKIPESRLTPQKKFPAQLPEPPLLVFLQIVSRHCRRRAGPLCRGGSCPAQPPRLVAISRGAPSLPGAKPSWFSRCDFSPPRANRSTDESSFSPNEITD